MIFYALALVIVLLGFVDFKKGFYAFLLFKFFLGTNVVILSIPGIPLLTVDLTLTCVFLVLFIMRGSKGKLARASFPWKAPMAVLVVAWFISAIAGIAGIGTEASTFVKMVVTNVLLIWMIWETIESPEDFRRLFIGFSVCFLISALYGIYEGVSHTNPFYDYSAAMNTDSSRVLDWNYSEDRGRGYRVRSVFDHAIGAGLNWAMYVAVVFILAVRKELPVKWLSVPTALLCLVCMVLCNSRAPFVLLLITALFVFKDNAHIGVAMAGCGVVGLAILAVFSSDYAANILSIFDSSFQDQVGGSHVSQRLGQISAAAELMSQSPLFGLGRRFETVLSNGLTARLLGSESVWIRALPSWGLLGTFGYAMLAWWSIYVIPRRYQSFELAFFALAYWVTYSLTSTPGMETYVLYLIMIAFVKRSAVYRELPDEAELRCRGKQLLLVAEPSRRVVPSGRFRGLNRPDGTVSGI